eukprot:5088552-Prorocentrum_lima.AAC.1
MPGPDRQRLLISVQVHQNQVLVRGIQSAMEAAGGMQLFTWRNEIFRPGRQVHAGGPGVVEV